VSAVRRSVSLSGPLKVVRRALQSASRLVADAFADAFGGAMQLIPERVATTPESLNTLLRKYAVDPALRGEKRIDEFTLV
jgi:hypothetical protein